MCWFCLLPTAKSWPRLYTVSHSGLYVNNVAVLGGRQSCTNHCGIKERKLVTEFRLFVMCDSFEVVTIMYCF